MRRRFLALTLMMGLMMAAGGRPAAAADPQMKDYMSTPFWLDGRTVPLVMLVLERDWKMFYPAYNNLNDLNGDEVIEIGFNPGVTYVGYFDPDSCYAYEGVGDNAIFTRSGPATEQTTAEAANLVPQSIKAQGRDIYKYDANGNRLDGSDGLNDIGIKGVRSIHGVCDRNRATVDGQGEWHGNWLNFATTSRMDAVRKVLYGGKRTIDTANRTVLELTSYLPGNSHNWGGELVADDLWADYARSSPWYDIPSFTGYITPAAGTMHFWARSSYYTSPNPTIDYASSSGTVSSTFMSNRTQARVYSPIPLFQFAAHIPATNYHPIYSTPLRIWDWVGDHGAGLLPNDWTLVAGADASAARQFAKNGYAKKPANQVARRFNARVEVCKPDAGDNVASGEGCRRYGSNYKPAGLLQQYGESDKMFFGLLTGTLQATTRWEGGVVRHHIQPFSNYVNPSTGVVIRPGDTVSGVTVQGSLIDTIDRLQVTGHGRFTANGATTYGAYTDATQAGNPLGEMVYEAVRYLSRRGDNSLAPTSTYHPGSNGEVGLPPYDNNAGALTKLHFENRNSSTNWGARPGLGDAAEKCSKPIVLVLSEVIPDHDKNTTFGANQSDFNNTPLMTGIDPANVPLTFSINTYLDNISDLEKLKTSADGELFFYPNQTKAYGTGESRTARGVCEPSVLVNGLRDIDGHCPSEPSLQGSYSIAAIAYYAHTHDMFHVAGVTPTAKDNPAPTSIDTYAVGIPGNFPDITFKVDEDRGITIMPITVARDNDANDNNGLKLRTLINFYVDSWEVDAKGRPYKLKFATNFEYTTTPAWVSGGGSNNMERDIFNRFEITLLTTRAIDAVSPKYREEAPIFINSGPFRTQDYINTTTPASYTSGPTTSNSRWFAAMEKWQVNGDPSGFDAGDEGGRPYYYAFRDPAYDPNDKTTPPLDLEELSDYIVGVAIQNASFGSFINMKGHGGYTISGVTRPGPYIEVGYHGSDNAYFGNTNCTGRVPVVLTGDYSSAVKPHGVSASDWAHCNGSVSSFSDRRGLPPGHRNPDHPDGLLTPWECPFYGYTAADRNADDVRLGYPAYSTANPNPTAICGYNTASGKKMRYVQVRSFLFDTNAPPVTPLPNPLWLATKYGGFRNDTGILGVPDNPSEWARDGVSKDDDPYNYFGVANISELPSQLGKAFETIASSVATGTANASSISTVLGGGLSIQTQYRTDYFDPTDAGNRLKWGGSVYSFFVDRWGNLRANTHDRADRDPTDPENKNRLELITSPSRNAEIVSSDGARKRLWDHLYPDEIGDWYEKGDLIVHTVTPDGFSVPRIFLCRDPYGDNNGNAPLPTDKAPDDPNAVYPAYSDCVTVRSFLGLSEDSFRDEMLYDAIGSVWNASQQLSDLVFNNGANDGHTQRRIYTYFGSHPADGSQSWATAADRDLANNLFTTANVGRLHNFMGQGTQEITSDLIDFTRGKEFGKYRNRTAVLPWDNQSGDNRAKPWIMGDVINSKPVIVGDAVANFHLLYGSASYSHYKSSFGDYSYDTGSGGGASKRRQVAYFGTNGGVLHAVNMGFFGALKDGMAGYKTKTDTSGYHELAAYTNAELGSELWAYVPTAVLPHLRWLADPEYSHGFFVDLAPFATDITDGSGTWRTILLVGLRLGGRTIELTATDPVTGAANTSYSYSEFFALDVTEPDSGPPKLMWRFSHPHLGLTSATPSIVRRAKDNESSDEWYAILPSGPTSDLGIGANRGPSVSDPEAAYQGRSTQKARVFIVNARTGYLEREPVEGDPKPLVASEADSFFNDTFTPRANYLVQKNKTLNGESVPEYTWSHHTVYMGLTSSSTHPDGTIRDSGAIYRLQMVGEDGQLLPVDDWQLRRLYSPGKPVTGAVNSAYDSRGNLWVIFGTGRVWGSKDLAPCGMDSNLASTVCCDNHDQYLYGLKEPLNSNGYLTFSEILDDSKIVDVSGLEVYEDGSLDNGPPVGLSVTTYDALSKGLAERGAGAKDGYRRKLEAWRSIYTCVDANNDGVCESMLRESERPRNKFEVITTQPKIDGLANGGSNTIFTSYEVSANICDPKGRSFLYVVDTYTGLPAPYMGNYSGFDPGQSKSASGKTNRQVTGIKKSGDYMASEAWIIKSDGQTVYGSTSFNSNRNMVYLPAGESESNAIVSWREVLDLGFNLLKDGAKGLFQDLQTTP